MRHENSRLHYVNISLPILFILLVSFFSYSQDTPLSGNNNYKISNINNNSDGTDDSNDENNNNSKLHIVNFTL
jgi:hypothetical protein